MNSHHSKPSAQEAEKILFKLYHLKGKAFRLPGFVDFNFKIVIDGETQYILKISRENSNNKLRFLLQDILIYLEKVSTDLMIPQIISDQNGNFTSEICNGNKKQTVRLLSWVSGRIWNDVNPRLDKLHYSLGETCGKLTRALLNFKHSEAHGKFEWDTANALWTLEHNHLFKKEEKKIISAFQKRFEHNLASYKRLRQSIVHNDANNYNIIVSNELSNPKVISIIDYGDAIYTQIINDVAIACCYAIMGHQDPLEAALPIVSGYHSVFPLQETELEHLYLSIAMRLIISYTSSVINQTQEPNNEYLQISSKPAWNLLEKWHDISADFAHYSFRAACDFPAHPTKKKFDNWALKHSFKVSNLFPTIGVNELKHLDLSVSSKWLGHEKNFNDLSFFQYKIDKLQAQNPQQVLSGGYLEPRALYTSSEYDKIGNNGPESRTIHLGIDFWLPAKTPVHALFDGEVVAAVNDKGDKEYGGLVILKHQVNDFEFFTLYGHNSIQSATAHCIGDIIAKGEKIAELGSSLENGNWAPHLHFQIMLSMLDYQVDFPGVTYPKQIDIWKSICPDPNLLFKSTHLQIPNIISNETLVKYRKKHLGKSLSLQYKTPLKMVRGSGVYLMDQYAQKYLDTVNNVAHVGHEHFNVVQAGQEQMALINTNSRYLHESINQLAGELIETLPEKLNVLHFVNSGSEANELAVRMAKIATGEKDIIASEAGYHGSTNLCVDISSYKFDGEGGSGAPEHTHIFSTPTVFRGKYKGDNISDHYAHEVQRCVININDKERSVAAFIIEPIISCGGQIELPKGFLQKAYRIVRDAGGVCISDEIQTGCGRMGKTFWGFQLHNVVPDIITIGKPLGNGHPVAAVACTQEIAEKFANGMEYFNTFGGNPVSSVIATEVLRTVKKENLQHNALVVGDFLKSELLTLSKSYPIIGDVRGQGLFLGFELVDQNLKPLPEQAQYLVNRIKEHHILMSIDGPDHNVIKIKPPMIFSITNAMELIFYLRKIFSEDFMRIYQ